MNEQRRAYLDPFLWFSSQAEYNDDNYLSSQNMP